MLEEKGFVESLCRSEKVMMKSWSFWDKLEKD